MRETPPLCLTLLLCEQVVRDRHADRVTLIGTFHSFSAEAFPALLPRCAVWIELTDGHGPTPMRFRLARVTPEELDGETVFESGFTVAFTDPRTIHSHHLSAVGLQLPEPGDYRLSINAFGLPLIERRLEVSRRGEQGR